MDDGRIKIEFGTRKNEREGYGFVPMIWVNDRREGGTWAEEFMSEDDATTAAHAYAKDEASRFVGDWDVTVTPRSATP